MDQEKREKLTDLLFELSKSQEILATPKDRAGYFRKLEEIYYNCDKDNFRHYYSDIFSTLSLINGDPTIGSLDILAQNIQTIKDGYCCFSKRMRKLFIKNEKSVLRFCNKSSKTKRAFTKVLMPCKRPF